jgi:hypothetical protein
MPSEHALAEGVIQLYAQKLKKVVVADELQIAPGEVTDSKLAAFCDSIRDDPPDILVLCGCRRVTNLSCLVQLSTISHLHISGCSLGAKGGFHLADIIKDMGALLVLSLKDNKLATKGGGKALAQALASNSALKELDVSSNTWEEHGNPRGGGPGFVQELAVGIKDNRALTSLDISSNSLYAKGTKLLAEVLKGNTIMTELNVSSNKMMRECLDDVNKLFRLYGGPRMSGVVALADAIPDMGALLFVSRYEQQFFEWVEYQRHGLSRPCSCKQHHH